jgi:hypothetical protein
MIKVIINETGLQETLSIIDLRTNVDFIKDFVGNYGAFSDGQFIYDEEIDAYRCDQNTYDWWAKVISDHQNLENRIAELKEEYGSERVQDVLDRVDGYDLEDLASAINKELDDAFGVPSGNLFPRLQA